MVPAVLFLLAAAPIEERVLPLPVVPAGATVRAVASAEVMRAGRIGGAPGEQDIAALVTVDRDGRILAEFR